MGVCCVHAIRFLYPQVGDQSSDFKKLQKVCQTQWVTFKSPLWKWTYCLCIHISSKSIFPTANDIWISTDIKCCA